jgi:hypothetical protein
MDLQEKSLVKIQSDILKITFKSHTYEIQTKYAPSGVLRCILPSKS